MTPCKICSRKKGERLCVKLGDWLCPECCGQHRIVHINCWTYCPFFLENKPPLIRIKPGNKPFRRPTVKHQPCVITLMTDFGDQDAYVGIMKGVITEVNPRANIIDICHSIPPQDIFKGAYLLYTSYKYFPKGTIHVAVVDPGVGSKRNIVCVETRNYLFLTPDNGILGFIIQEERPKRIIRVTNNNYFLPAPSNTFHGRDVFAPVAAHLSLGIKPKQLGNATKQLEHLSIPQPVRKNTRQLEGQIISIDHFGNLVTNITKSHLEEYVREQIRDLDRKSGVRSQKPKIRNQTPDEPGKSSKKKDTTAV